jgi:hypothetical protein
VQIGLAAESRNRYPIVAHYFVTNNPLTKGLHKMSQNYYVYTHSLAGQPPFYVGKGNEKRIKKVTRESNPHHANIVAKYGKENIIVKTMLCRSEQHALDLEVRMIAALRNSGVKLSNITDGGDGVSGLIHTKESRLKMSVAVKKSHSNPATKKRMSESAKNRPPISNETRLKMSNLSSGRIMSKEARQKISTAKKGKYYNGVMTDKTREKLSESVRSAWSNPLLIEKQRETSSLIWNDLEKKEKMILAVKEAHKNPEIKKKHSDNLKKALSTPEARLIKSEAARLSWEKRKANK